LLPGGLAAAPAPHTQVLVVGTIHQRHASNPNYSYQDLVRILDTYNPDLVCVEIRPQEFRRKLYLTEMTLATIWALARNKSVYPIDWWMDSPNDREVRAQLEKTPEYRKKAAELKDLTAANSILNGMCKQHGALGGNAKLGYAFWNGTDYQTCTAEGYRLSIEIYGDSPMNLHYQSRNQHMADLILAALKEKPVPKAIVLTGSEHKHFFDRAFRENPNLSVVDFSSLLPLKEATLSGPVREFLEEENDLPYFQPGYPEDLNLYFGGKMMNLLHGPDMDFYPEKIPQANIFKAEKVLARWRSRFPDSLQLRLDLAWYAFLIGNDARALSLFQGCAEKFEKGELRETIEGIMAYQGLGRCYDLAGDRQKALACYAKVEKLAAGTLWERVKHLLVSLEKPYQRVKVFQAGTPELLAR
jgi:RNase H-fold protein (predicted Holliday junction resolvase)